MIDVVTFSEELHGSMIFLTAATQYVDWLYTTVALQVTKKAQMLQDSTKMAIPIFVYWRIIAYICNIYASK